MFIGPQQISSLLYLFKWNHTNSTFTSATKVNFSGAQVPSALVYSHSLPLHSFSSWLKAQKEPNWEPAATHWASLCPGDPSPLRAFISKTLMTLCHTLWKEEEKMPLKAVFITASDFFKMPAVRHGWLWHFLQCLSLSAASPVSGFPHIGN